MDVWTVVILLGYLVQIKCDDVIERRQTGASVQLVGGQYPWEGRVFVRGTDGRYGALCSSLLSGTDRNIICRSIFKNSDIAGVDRPVNSFGGSLENHVLMSSLRCTGSEDDVTICPGMSSVTWSDKSTCVRGEAGISCQGSSQMRLFGGKFPYQGRLEVYQNGTWGSVCNRGFTSEAARVVCDKLGYWSSGAQITSAASYGHFTGPVLMENIKCSGNEPNLDFCSWNSSNCTHTTDVGLNCQPSTVSSSLVRLTDGPNPWTGRVELYNRYSQYRWSAICGNGNNSFSAIKTLCSSLGFKYGGKTVQSMPEGATKVHIRQLSCTGKETNIGLCRGFEMSHSNDCGTYPPTTLALDCSGGLQVRLTGGENPLEGKVEIYNAGRWSPVLGTVVQVEEARVFCASLGYQTNHAIVLPVNSKGKGASPEINALTCSSRNKHISQCTVGAPAANARPSAAAIKCFNCSQLFTGESGQILSPGYPNSTSENTDCLYHIQPKGAAALYKMFFSRLQLGNNDIIQVSENPITGPITEYTKYNLPNIYLFKKNLYIRFKTFCCGPRSFLIRWQPVTLESTVQLLCTDTYMKIDVNTTELSWLYPDTNPAYISLINEGCTGSYQGDTWTITNQHTDCFTNRKIDSKEVTYSNALIYKEIGSGPIVREHRWRVDMDCAFNRDISVNQGYNVDTQYNYIKNLTTNYQAEIHMYNDSTLRHEMSFEPIRAKLGDDLYVKVNLKGHWNVSMRLQHCVGKPDPNSTISYSLVQNGCSVDKETHVIYEDPTTTLFHFKAFEFYAGYSTVYLSCDVTFCTPDDNSSICTWKCDTSHTKRDNSVRTSSAYTVRKQLEVV